MKVEVLKQLDFEVSRSSSEVQLKFEFEVSILDSEKMCRGGAGVYGRTFGRTGVSDWPWRSCPRSDNVRAGT